MADDELPDGHELIRLLEERNWVVVAERNGFYTRLKPYLHAEHSVVVPTNPNAADYVTLLVAATQTLDDEHSHLWSSDLQPKISAGSKTHIPFSESGLPTPDAAHWNSGNQFPVGSKQSLEAINVAHRAQPDITSRTKRP
jgi:hypothetical protein